MTTPSLSQIRERLQKQLAHDYQCSIDDVYFYNVFVSKDGVGKTRIYGMARIKNAFGRENDIRIVNLNHYLPEE